MGITKNQGYSHGVILIALACRKAGVGCDINTDKHAELRRAIEESVAQNILERRGSAYVLTVKGEKIASDAQAVLIASGILEGLVTTRKAG